MEFSNENELCKYLYQKMKEIRYFEQGIETQYKRNIVRGAAHLSLGEEGIAAGVCAALNDKDYILTTHRGHGHLLAKGSDPKYMMAELLGRADGYCQGKGGSMHIADYSVGVLCANGIVGAGLPISTGAGLAMKLKKLDNIVVCFFGDGATGQGGFHEALNMASAWDLPILFVLENNGRAISTDTHETMAPEKITDLSEAYGIKSAYIDGNDVLKVYDTAKELKEYILKEGKPAFIEANTYRLSGHYIGDDERYRTKEEVKEHWKTEPIVRFEEYIAENKPELVEEFKIIDEEARERLDKAIEFAIASPEPSVEGVKDAIFSYGPAWDEWARRNKA